MSKRRPLTYEIIQHIRAGAKTLEARMQCSRCPAHITISMSGQQHNPEFVAKKFREKGWAADGRVARKCICPGCLKAKKESGGGVADVELQNIKLGKISMAPRNEPRALTADEKGKVRLLLDAHFDDSIGAFLDGYSDQRIGDEVNVPWAAVAKMREAAYGEIRTPPEILNALQTLEVVKGMVSEANRRVDAAEAEIRKYIDKAKAG